MPDLIRLLHGNPSGLKNLVKEFRMYWKKKTNPETEESALENSKLDVSMDVDDRCDKDGSPLDISVSKSLNDSKIESQDQFSISKRQLEIKIPAVAVREKRPEHRKICWYVHANVLKQYNMEDIKLPNSWEYVCAKKPEWAEEKTLTSKVDDCVAQETSSPVPVKAAPSIMQFAQPMTLSEIQAQVAAKGSRETPVKPSEKTSEPKPKVQQVESSGKGNADQKSIKVMFSPAARKSLNNVKTVISACETSQEKSAVTDNLGKAASGQGPSTVTEKLDKSAAKVSTTPCVVIDDGTELVKPTTPVRTTGSKVMGTSTPPAHVLKSMLSSPELMKTSPKQAPASKENVSEEPMDVDIIVLD